MRVSPSIEQAKLPPQAVDMEEAVLGALLIEKEAIDDVLKILGPECFYKQENQKIYAAIQALHDKSNPVDILTVTQQLRKTGELELVGGPYYITRLTNRVAGSDHAEYHAKIVFQKHILREVIRISGQLYNLAFDESEDVFDILEKAQKNLYDITLLTSKKDVAHISGPISEVLKEMDDTKENDENGLPWGFGEIDNLTAGLHAPDLIIVAARPGVGKTAFALCIARNIVVAQKKPVAIFSLEMSAKQLTRRLLAIESNLNVVKLRDNDFQPVERMNVVNAGTLLSNTPLYIDDTAGLTLFEFKAKARRLVQDKKVEFIIVDYLQLMEIESSSKVSNREQEISKISRGLKVAAKELDIPIMALSQLSRETEKRKMHRPILSDLRESGCLTAETKIYCPHLKQDLRIIDLVGRKNFHIFATNLKTTKIMEAVKCFKTGKQEVFEMTLLNGQKISATSNHKFLTSDGWVELKDLLDRNVAIPINYGNEKHSDSISAEISIIGHFLSNGSALKGKPIRYACNIIDDDLTQQIINDALKATDNKVAPYFKDTMLEKGNFRTIYFKPTFHLTHGKTSPIADIMRKYNLFDVRSKQKFIPSELFYTSHENTCLLLRALFSGDGTVYYQEKKGRKSLKISYSSASPDLIQGVQRLLAKIGIVSFISDVKNKKKQSWQNLYIAGKSNLELFVKKVGFYQQRKQDTMFDGWEKSKNNLAGWNKYEFNENRTLCFMPVKSIVSLGIHDVYDIEVPKLHNFVANGIVTHNSIEQDADMVMFLFRPEYHGETKDKDGKDLRGMAEVIIAKHRNGAIDSAFLRYRAELTKFENYIEENEIKESDKLDEEF